MSSTTEEFPRPLTEREDSILRFLLSVEAPGVGALRQQADAVRAVGKCGCGCATVDLAVDRSAAPRSELGDGVVIDTTSLEKDDADRLFQLLLFLDDGWLESVEIVYFGDFVPPHFPPPDDFSPPELVQGAPIVPPIILADGWDVSFYQSEEGVSRQLEPWLLKAKHRYVAYDSEGRRLELFLSQDVVTRRWRRDKTTERVALMSTEREPTHRDELAKFLAEWLAYVGESVPPSSTLDALLRASIARNGYT